MQDFGLHYWVLIAQSRLHRAISRQVCGAGGLMPGQPKILEFLSAHDGCTQKEIGQGCALDKSTVTSLLGRMIDNGLVQRRADENDRRTVRIRLTETGRAKAREVEIVFAQVDARAWQGVNPDEQAQFMRILRQIIDNMGGIEQE